MKTLYDLPYELLVKILKYIDNDIWTLDELKEIPYFNNILKLLEQ
jgi:hypothetical protein